MEVQSQIALDSFKGVLCRWCLYERIIRLIRNYKRLCDFLGILDAKPAVLQLGIGRGEVERPFSVS